MWTTGLIAAEQNMRVMVSVSVMALVPVMVSVSVMVLARVVVLAHSWCKPV